MTATHAIYDALGETAKHHAHLCPAVSKPLLETLVDRLPRHPALTLSVGCGSGLLEALILEAGLRDPRKAVNIYGVEVPDCEVKYLPEERIRRVPNTVSVFDDVLLASTVLFVYPRQTVLIAQYLDVAGDGALDCAAFLGHRNDWPEVEMLFLAAFSRLDHIDGPGIAESEMLVFAYYPRRTRRDGA